MLTAEKAFIEPASLIFLDKLLFCDLFSGHAVFKIKMDGVMQNSTVNQVVIWKNRNLVDMSILVL